MLRSGAISRTRSIWARRVPFVLRVNRHKIAIYVEIVLHLLAKAWLVARNPAVGDPILTAPTANRVPEMQAIADCLIKFFRS